MRYPFVLAVILFLLTAPSIQAGDRLPYRHPVTGLTVWGHYERLLRPEDPNILHVHDGDRHVVLWFTDTQSDAHAYCRKMSHMRDVDDPTEPTVVEVAGLTGYTVTASGREFGKDVMETMVVLPDGASPDQADHERLHVILVWGPRTTAETWQTIADGVLGSLTISGAHRPPGSNNSAADTVSAR